MPQTLCKRCGVCCQKGGPCLHVEDAALFKHGVLSLAHVFTVRPGETARDNVTGRLAPTPAEFIKLKGKAGSWECLFYDPKIGGCGIYEDRPMECRLLKCWDTREIEAYYRRGRLGRKDLIAPADGVWRFIQAHEERCGHRDLTRLIDVLKTEQAGAAAESMMDMLHYDMHFRSTLVEKAGLPAEKMDFFFGRALAEVIKGFGLQAVERDGTFFLAPAG